MSQLTFVLDQLLVINGNEKTFVTFIPQGILTLAEIDYVSPYKYLIIVFPLKKNLDSPDTK